jgi:diguanylate cyclase (GGDEF)-like protein
MTAAHRRPLLLAFAGALYVLIFAAFCIVERPGLGIGHFYYLPVAVVAMATGPVAGVAAGVLAAGLYTAGIFLNTDIPSVLQIAETAIRLLTFGSVGWLIGIYARSNRRLVGELSQLAERDALTGLPNTRAFEVAIESHIARGDEFTLLVGDVDELRALNRDADGDEALRQIADMLSAAKRPQDHVARVGGDEFAVVACGPEVGRAFALKLERLLELGGVGVTFGWSTFRRDGETALALYRAADERLYARKVARGYRRGPAQTASLQHTVTSRP